jgi:CheY-like chemotaxis protein
MPDSIDPQPPLEVHPTVPIMASIAPLVLLVDDNAEVLLLLSEYLHLHGYRVDQAHTGSEALVRAQTEPPACIIMDIQLPEMNGLTVIPMLRTHSITTPILVLSAHAMPGDHEQALAAGANAYLSKPVRMMELLTTIAALIHAHGSGL